MLRCSYSSSISALLPLSLPSPLYAAVFVLNLQFLSPGGCHRVAFCSSPFLWCDSLPRFVLLPSLKWWFEMLDPDFVKFIWTNLKDFLLHHLVSQLNTRLDELITFWALQPPLHGGPQELWVVITHPSQFTQVQKSDNTITHKSVYFWTKRSFRGGCR